MRLVIRPCSVDDLDVLAMTQTPVEMLTHEERFQEQERGDTTYLMAWDDKAVAGHMKIRWGGSVHELVRSTFPAVPEFRRLRVSPDMQGKGIGSQLLAAAESLVAMQGFYFSGLCVAVSNTGARRLYERHGYFDWGRGVFDSHWDERKEDGTIVHKSHEVTYMAKALNGQRRAIA